MKRDVMLALALAAALLMPGRAVRAADFSAWSFYIVEVLGEDGDATGHCTLRWMFGASSAQSGCSFESYTSRMVVYATSANDYLAGNWSHQFLTSEARSVSGPLTWHPELGEYWAGGLGGYEYDWIQLIDSGDLPTDRYAQAIEFCRLECSIGTTTSSPSTPFRRRSFMRGMRFGRTEHG